MHEMRNVLGWAALLAALVGTASAEYHLAIACGFGAALAGCVPAALDIYALAAFKAHRDVPAVVTTLIAVNAASHLVSSGLLAVSVPLVVAVSAIAPLVLWRVHALQADADEMQPDADAAECSPEPEVRPIAPDAAYALMDAVQPTPSAPEMQPVAEQLPEWMHSYIEDARRLDAAHREAHGRPIPLRALQSELRIGQRRAQELKAALR